MNKNMVVTREKGNYKQQTQVKLPLPTIQIATLPAKNLLRTKKILKNKHKDALVSNTKQLPATIKAKQNE